MQNIEENTMRKHIINEFNDAYDMLLRMYEGEDINDENINDIEHIEKLLLKLLHFRQYTNMFQYAFLNWELIFDDQNEQCYLDLGDKAKRSTTLLIHNVFKDTLASILVIKSTQEDKTIEEIHDKYMKKIKDMWIMAGLISN